MSGCDIAARRGPAQPYVPVVPNVLGVTAACLALGPQDPPAARNRTPALTPRAMEAAMLGHVTGRPSTLCASAATVNAAFGRREVRSDALGSNWTSGLTPWLDVFSLRPYLCSAIYMYYEHQVGACEAQKS